MHLIIMLLTLYPIQPRFSNADIWLAYLIPALTLLGVIFMFLQKGKLKITWTDILMILWGCYIFIRVYIGNECACSTQLLRIGITMLLYLALRLFWGTKEAIPSSLLVASLICCGCYETLIGVQQVISGSSRHNLYAMTGTFLNPGPYSAYLMIGIVACFATLEFRFSNGNKNESRARRIMVIATKTACTLMLFILPSTLSRAALVSVGICALWIYYKQYKKYAFYVFATLCILLLGLYFTKQGSADGRIVIWVASITSWLHSPFWGNGVGGFCNSCAEGIAELWAKKTFSPLLNSAGVTEYAYNELLKVLVEQGLIGASIFVALIIVVMHGLYKQDKSLFAILLSLLIFSMFSYPLEILPYRIIIVLFAAWTASYSREKVREEEHVPTRFLTSSRMITTIGALAVSACSIIIAKDSKQRMDIDNDVILFSGMNNRAFIDDYYELLPKEMDNSQFLFDFAKTLRHCGRYRDSNAILNLGKEVSADPMFYVLMGNNYKDENFIEQAEWAYNKAFSIMPNRLYPLYQLMLMYDEYGETEKCRNMAKQIINMRPKVESPATSEMKQKAKELLGLI